MPWKPLQLSPSAGVHLPPLLISTTLSPSSYTVHLTDLTHIWSESLSKKDIIRRSREESTSIDPSNTDQFQIFLEKIEIGLAGRKNTALALTINSEAERPSFVLHVTVSLPGGLEPLEWSVKLAAAPQHLLTSQLTVPLLRAQHERLQELASLAEVLKEKDHVIQKLMDKLEDQGTELGQVFPQATVKAGRKVDRRQAEERVKGLGSFNMKNWSDGLSGQEGTQTLPELLGEVFQDDPARDVVHGAASEEAENWWDDMKGITVNLESGKISTKGLRRGKKVAQKLLPEEDSDDDFQVQATPPHLAKLAEESTDDEDLDAPSQRSKVPDSFPVPQPTPPSPPQVARKLGIVGKKQAPEPEPMVEDDTASEDEESPPRPPPSPPRRTPTPDPSPKAQKKLGRIGGKKETPLPESEPEQEPEPPKLAPKKGKLGTIGGKRKQPSPPPDPETGPEHPKRKVGAIGHGHIAQKEETIIKEERGRTPKKTTPEPRETSEERADKKRAQLKRELEQKSKAPAKKKKKF